MCRGLAVALAAAVAAYAILLVVTGERERVQPSGARLAHGFGRLPLSFEAGRGRFDTHSGAAGISLRRGEALLDVQGSRLRMRAGRLGAPVAGDRLPGIVNRFHGSDPARWRTGIPTFGSVRYSSVWPGIDLRFHGTGGRLEYDFEIAPGADPGQIWLDFSGQRGIRLDDGDIVLGTRAGDVRLQAPVAFQGSTSVDVRHVLGADGRIGFELGRYDRSRPLTIDPVLAYSTYLGDSDIDKGFGVAVDPQGNTYVTGISFRSSSTDMFVTKLNADGSGTVFTTYIGGSSYDEGRGIAVTAVGRAYIVGSTDSSNFPTTTGVIQQNSGGSRDAFVVGLDLTGGVLAATCHGGSGYDQGWAIALDGNDNAYVTGDTDSSNFPTVNPRQAARGGSADAYVTKFNPTLTGRTYSTYHGGATGGGQESGRGIAVDSNGGAIVTGFTDSLTFPLVNAIQPDGPTVFTDAFVSRFSNGGTQLTYSTYLGGGAGDRGLAIALGTDSGVYLAGSTDSDDFPLAGALQGESGGNADAFVTKINSAGSALVYSTYLGGGASDIANGIAVDGAGNALVAGKTLSTDFPLMRALRTEKVGSSEDAFVAKLNAAGSALAYSTYLGGSDYDIANGIAVGPDGAAVVAGETQSTDFPVIGAVQPTIGGPSNSDAFVTTVGDPPLGHFVGYQAKVAKSGPKFFKLGPVRLADATFGFTADYDVLQPNLLALPANKNGEGFTDPATHLMGYAVKLAKGSPKFAPRADVGVVNQCGDVVLTAKKPVTLLLPTGVDVAEPTPNAVDHFLCYQAKTQKALANGTPLPPFPKGVQADVSDAFQTRRYDLKKVASVCLPVAKSGSPRVLAGPSKGTPFVLEPATVGNPESFLVCYRAKLATKTIPQNGCGPVDPADKGSKIVPKQPKHASQRVQVGNQLGGGTLDTKKESLVCIASNQLGP